MDVAAEIARLQTLSSADLRARWSAVTGSVVPRVSPRLLRLALAWELQANVHGGLSRETTRTLDQLARGLTRTAPVQADMRLVREWQGKAHVVTIGEDKVIRWDGRTWGSLSEVARAITGTRWSGPAFFGLKTRARVPA
jgi:Protein of unknown function (DUF2924)